ncbi:hypothetical protein MLD38_032193 [Melastoma candidum]|uniref:Uncharacterized protein n=1 Tax=Melastoma candidum TaxID=119954 RepID=A0ACB9M6F2_9MYRT|nr:hypothetical protein MLD38_032193 [Melastoma candidum]
MNPLTLVKRIQKINSREAALGISEEASWHAKYKDSAYVYVGGIPFDLTEGDLLAVFAQYGEIVDVNLIRDKGTGKSKGFAFVAYEDQRSTNLAVDNLNGAQILGRVIRVDHCNDYKKKEEEDEEELQRKREERGVCRAFQRGECTRGAGCKFSHNEQRAANTGWGAEDKEQKWGHDMYDGPRNGRKESGKGSKEYPARHMVTDISSSRGRHGDDDANPKSKGRLDRSDDVNLRKRLGKDEDPDRRHRDSDRRDVRRTDRYRDDDDENRGRPTGRRESREEYRSRRDDDRDDRSNSRLRGDHIDASDGKRSKRHESGSYPDEDRGRKSDDRSSDHGRDRSLHRR